METAGECSRLITENREAIISEWEVEVRQEIIGAGMSDSVALRNHLPELLDDIAEIFIEKQKDGFNHKTDKYAQTFEKNEFHGRLRAETENYTIDQVILEYFILHRIITELLQNHKLLSVNIANLLKYILERTVMQASAAFSISIQEMQDKLLGTLAHDIRNPLTTALSSADLQAEIPEKNERLIELIRKSIRRSVDLTEVLLDTIALKAGKGMMLDFSESDYTRILREACEEASDIYLKKVVCDLPEGAVKGNFDNSAIRRMIDNLISNAIKHGAPDSPIKIALKSSKEEITLLVNNQGKAIPAEKQKSIFNFLKRGDDQPLSQNKGWGMGLTLVKLIADAHEGAVDLQCDDQGTTFKVTLKRHLGYSGKVRMRLS